VVTSLRWAPEYWTPEYEALSYVWGDPLITRPIKLNGQPYHATENLEAALR
jgi:Heterokaryon incompatibility protein (HET)